MSPVASALVRLYPPSWRRRYAAEFAALLDDAGVRPRDVVDIVPAAVALAMVLGGVPLAVDIARRTRRHVVLLCTPLVAAFGFATVLDVLVPRSTRPGVGVGAAWFTTLVVIGLVAGVAAAAGPALAVHRGRAAPHTLAVAVVAGTCATATMVASVLAALGFVLARNGGGTLLTGYAAAMAALVTVAATSCRRGMRAAVGSEGDAGARG